MAQFQKADHVAGMGETGAEQGGLPGVGERGLWHLVQPEGAAERPMRGGVMAVDLHRALRGAQGGLAGGAVIGAMA